MDTAPDGVAAVGDALAEGLDDAGEAGGGEDGAGVDLVTDDMGVFVDGECDKEVELLLCEGCAQGVGWVGEEEAFHFQVLFLGALVGFFEGVFGDGEVVAAGAVDCHDFHSSSPLQVPIKSRHREGMLMGYVVK